MTTGAESVIILRTRASDPKEIWQRHEETRWMEHKVWGWQRNGVAREVRDIDNESATETAE